RIEIAVAAIIRNFERAILGDVDETRHTAPVRDIDAAAGLRVARRRRRRDECRVRPPEDVERPFVIKVQRFGSRETGRLDAALVTALNVLRAIAEALLDPDHEPRNVEID